MAVWRCLVVIVTHRASTECATSCDTASTCFKKPTTELFCLVFFFFHGRGQSRIRLDEYEFFFSTAGHILLLLLLLTFNSVSTAFPDASLSVLLAALRATAAVAVIFAV